MLDIDELPIMIAAAGPGVMRPAPCAEGRHHSAMAFAVLVDALNMLAKRRRAKSRPRAARPDFQRGSFSATLMLSQPSVTVRARM